MTHPLSDDDIRRIVEKMQSGATINVQDTRVSKVQNWLLAMIGVGIVGGITWVGGNISGLREQLAVLVDRTQYIMDTLADHNERIKELERRDVPR